jgi:hypothetical protein
MAGKHAEGNPDRPARRMDVPKEARKELGDAVKKAKQAKKDGNGGKGEGKK